MPELSTSDEWRTKMKRSRQGMRLSQRALAVKVGVKQPVISGLESGHIKASKAVTAIARVLKIDLPYVTFRDALEARYFLAARKLRDVSDELFLQQLQMLEAAVEALSSRSPEH